jgi:hypothetical protein
MMIERGLISQLEGLGWDVTCPKSFPTYDHLRPKKEAEYKNLKNITYVSEVTKEVHNLVKKSAEAGNFVITLGK